MSVRLEEDATIRSKPEKVQAIRVEGSGNPLRTDPADRCYLEVDRRSKEYSTAR